MLEQLLGYECSFAFGAGFRQLTVAFLYAVGGFGLFSCTACVQYFENALAPDSVNPD
jgi:hypothetical protein